MSLRITRRGVPRRGVPRGLAKTPIMNLQKQLAMIITASCFAIILMRITNRGAILVDRRMSLRITPRGVPRRGVPRRRVRRYIMLFIFWAVTVSFSLSSSLCAAMYSVSPSFAAFSSAFASSETSSAPTVFDTLLRECTSMR